MGSEASALDPALVAAAQARAEAGADPGLHERVVIVTGAARGLGASIAGVLGEAGARLVVADIDFEGAHARVATLQAIGVEAIAVPLDVTDEGQVATVVARTHEHWGRIDVIVNNAAIDVTLPVAELSPAQWERELRVNLSGPFLLVRAALPHLRRGAHVVNIASTAAKRAWPNAAAYHASKWGLLGLSHALHAELRPQGIKVTAIVAGGMRTPFLLDRFPDIDTTTLQDPLAVAQTVRFVLQQPEQTVIPEVMVLPMAETSWP